MSAPTSKTQRFVSPQLRLRSYIRLHVALLVHADFDPKTSLYFAPTIDIILLVPQAAFSTFRINTQRYPENAKRCGGSGLVHETNAGWSIIGTLAFGR